MHTASLETNEKLCIKPQNINYCFQTEYKILNTYCCIFGKVC